MKIKIFVTLTMIAMLSCQSDPGNQSKKEDLKNVLSAYYNAMSKKDIQQMKTLTTDDFVLFDDGVIYTNESAAKAVAQLPEFSVSFTFDSLHVNTGEKDASAYYFREAKFTIEDSAYTPLKLLESATFKWQDGGWKLRFLHSSVRK